MKIPESYKQAKFLSETFNVGYSNYKSISTTPRIITLAGPCGTGKTWDACAWLNNAQSQGRTIAYMKAGDLWRYDSEDLARAEWARCAVIDDYGTKLSQGNLGRILDLVDNRMNSARRFTILTTNILTEIRTIDERLASRLNSGCMIDYTGLPDRREG